MRNQKLVLVVLQAAGAIVQFDLAQKAGYSDFKTHSLLFDTTQLVSQRVPQISVELLLIPLSVVWKFCSVPNKHKISVTDYGQVVSNLRYNVAGT